MNKTFKKSIIILLFLLILAITFSGWFMDFLPPGEISYSILVTLTIISIGIVAIEWRSEEKTHPIIQILIGVIPILGCVYELKFPSDPLSGILIVILPILIIIGTIFVISGIRGIINNTKKIK